MTPPRPNEGIDVHEKAQEIIDAMPRAVHWGVKKETKDRIVALCTRIRAETEAVVTKRERDILKSSLTTLEEAREMLGVFEDNGGHDGLRGEGYRVTLDHIDDVRMAIRTELAAYESNDAGEKG